MAQDETIQNIIERMQNARDRCQNAGDHQGVMDATQAILDLQSLRATALPTARDIEDYFNQRISGRAKKASGAPRVQSTVSPDDLSDDDSDDS